MNEIFLGHSVRQADTCRTQPISAVLCTGWRHIKGEAEAIALAIEKRDRLIIDDLKGRRTAETYKIERTTTLGLMFGLLVNGALAKTDYVRNVKNYGSPGWISGEILEEFVERGQNLE
jgi:predicted nucleic acid-binding protein